MKRAELPDGRPASPDSRRGVLAAALAALAAVLAAVLATALAAFRARAGTTDPGQRPSSSNTAPTAPAFPDFAAAPEHRWYEAALAMRRRAESWGDQPYGAVLVAGGTLAGEGPSRVVKDSDPNAHAERVAIRDAQRRLNREWLGGAVLYSTSRPCPACEAAAAAAGVARMIHGPALTDAGRPRPRSP